MYITNSTSIIHIIMLYNFHYSMTGYDGFKTIEIVRIVTKFGRHSEKYIVY